jgi:GDP-4-dehydro-6-deoxy-D-mannose reductase
LLLQANKPKSPSGDRKIRKEISMAEPIAVKEMPQNRLLITGADGFVGSYLIKEALHRYGDEIQIHAISLSEKGNALSDERVVFQSLDITDASALEDAVKEFCPASVIHLAAISHVPTATKNPQKVWLVNAMGTLNLLEAMRKYTPDATLLNISSSEIYGASFQSGKSVDESALLQPRNAYASSKAAADIMAMQYKHCIKKIIRARPFNHIGPGQPDDFVVPAFASQIAAIERGVHPPELRVGNLEAVRDFCDVRDVVCAYLELLENAKTIENSAAFNICSGKPRSIRSVLEDLTELSTAKFEITQDEGHMRLSETPYAVGCGKKMEDISGWSPKYPWDETLSDVLNFWRQKS